MWAGVDGYERTCVSEYVHQVAGKLVLSRPDHEPARQLFRYNEEPIVQPYVEVDLWLKQKALDLKAYTTALESLEELVAERTRVIEKKAGAETKLNKLKTRPDKLREATQAEGELAGLYKEAENLTAILNIAIAYMTDVFLPLFKRRQLMLFYRILERLVDSRATHYANISQAWSIFLGDKNLKHF